MEPLWGLSLRLRQMLDLEGRNGPCCLEGAHYVVTGQEGDFS